jgi:predicted nucleic acid-binding protein
MGLLIDTNVFILAERARQTGHPSDLLARIASERTEDDALISVITVSELELGPASPTGIRSSRRTWTSSNACPACR